MPPVFRRAVLFAFASACLVSLVPPAARADAPQENTALTDTGSEELRLRARRLFEAILADRPELADEMFFPKEPFLRLKDVAQPARYFDQLLATFHRDVHDLHAKRRSWKGASFQSFEAGASPKWVKPGDEWNKIGYHRIVGSKIHYDVEGRHRTLEVRTLISWEGRWFVTHLLPIRR
jgi:hypothetical protein